MRTTTLLIAVLVLLQLQLNGQQAKYVTSLDGKIRAQIIDINHDDIEENYDLVKIFRNKDEITEYPLVRSKDGMARSVYASAWSPDSRFFVFLTKYVGLHSVWHSPTSIYDSKTNIFWELDRYIGSIVDDKIKFIDGDILVIKILNPKGGDSAPPIIKKISLSKLLEDIEKGDIKPL